LAEVKKAILETDDDRLGWIKPTPTTDCGVTKSNRIGS
jgi:hypothetical protein